MGGALVDNFRQWCKHRWNRLNAPCVASDVVAPETTVSLQFSKDNRPRSTAPSDSSEYLETTAFGACEDQKNKRRTDRPDRYRSKNDQEVEFFTEYGEATRYILQEVVGKGSYGVVCSAIDTHTGDKVAIKKITNIFEHVSDATRILREIKLLRLLHHPDIVELKHIMLPPSPMEFKDIYVVFELMESDLHQVIKANDDLTPEHYQFFLYQLLRALKYIHTANVFHRDLKPKNVLANADCKLKICDFGLARVAFNDAPTAIFWTDYVATRWYRAPELCGSFFSKYTPAVDIWSIGCIFAEVLLGKPLFPGKNVVHQLDLITDLLGTPPPEAVSKIRNDKARRYLSSMPKKFSVPFSQKFPNADPSALRLLQKLLAFDPKDRPTAEEALLDPYFKGLSKVEREPSARPLNKLEFDFERRKVSKEDVKELIYREILEYHPQMLKECLQGKGSGRFVYPSPAVQFKRHFTTLEESFMKGISTRPPNREHSSLPKERVLDFREDTSRSDRESENRCLEKGLGLARSFRASQKAFQGGHITSTGGKVAEEGKRLSNGAAKEITQQRLIKSASVNASYSSSAPIYAKRNPSMRSEADLMCRDTSIHDAVNTSSKGHQKSHILGFELAKRIHAIRSGLVRS
ncbi:hypothetical protein KP509_07G044400 [Ceratopteris richardii]|uniref:mitogen-activated protein kinase n=1 Tax=Ceratopteris richardii TaxID=49495 RepID=A0A8T2UKP1_CERRI|nr:hypothetical protein KP509_07G044400 [Ceratopteris richardii]KAH7432879.1 hypothetical protein KP509_07G044400 [Ceratopteris richardii]KAH7432880.1 hypothetical protein KP509_07G044400 [Ceratopteris richardii]KAH7432881.1 hypothetical protein KP509_07G044400 [Ceratopteris richardii]